jgi:serine/threonine-protein kinase
MSASRLRRGLVGSAWVLLCATLALPSVARADASALDKASAEALFQDAMKLIADKRDAEGCPKLEESQRLDPAMGTQFRLAECYEATGRTASAWANYLEVADTARNAGQTERERVARDRAASVEAKLSRLTVVVATPDLPGLEVRRDGVILGAAQWGLAVPVDPATYDVTASAPGKRAWSGSATVTGDRASAALYVPALQDAPMVLAPELRAPSPSPMESLPTAPVVEKPRTRWGALRATGLVVAGAGVVGLGLGAAFGLDAISKRSEADSSGCSGVHCPPGASSIRDEARTAANVATVFFAVGGALAAGGLGLWLFGPNVRAPGAVATFMPGGFVISGQW